jgi:hypothetical protein
MMIRVFLSLVILFGLSASCGPVYETVTPGTIEFTTTATVTSPAQTTHTVTLTVPSTFTGLTLIPTTMPQDAENLFAADVAKDSEFKVVLNVQEYPFWDWQAVFDASALSLLEKQYYPLYTNAPGKPNMVGGAGRVEFLCKALKDGRTDLIFERTERTTKILDNPIFYILNIGQTEKPVIVPPRGQFNVGLGQHADDLFFTPGGVAYYGNVQQGTIPNPFPHVDSGTYDLKKDGRTIHVDYRFAIETLAGQTRNNIVRVTGLEFPPLSHSLYFYVAGPPDRFEFTRIGEGELGLVGAATSVLAIEIPAGMKPGTYSFEIGIVADGVDYGAVPCVVRVNS